MKPGNPTLYKIEDLGDTLEMIIGLFYGNELQLAEPEALPYHKRINKILRR